MERINDKKNEIEKYLKELDAILPQNFEEYLANLEKRLACERAMEKIIEAVNDFAIILIKEKRLPTPKDDLNAFDILSDKEIISKELSAKLKDAKGMRNFLAHQYGKIDDELVFQAVSEELPKDVEEFLEKMEKIKLI